MQALLIGANAIFSFLCLPSSGLRMSHFKTFELEHIIASKMIWETYRIFEWIFFRKTILFQTICYQKKVSKCKMFAVKMRHLTFPLMSILISSLCGSRVPIYVVLLYVVPDKQFFTAPQ